MRAVVLVGGFGTRLRPLTADVPKQMLPIVGIPMIERVVAGLGSHGVTEAVLSLGYRPDAFIDAYPDGICAGVVLYYAVEPEPLDTAGAVRFAAESAQIDDTFIVVNGDVLTDLNVTELWNFHKSHGAEGTIALTPVDDPSRYGVVPIDDDGRVIAFVEKPAPGTAPTNWINAGTYVLEPSILDRIDSDRRVSIERATFPSVVADGGLFALHSDAYWIDAGTPATYLRAQLDLIDGHRSSESGLNPSAEVDSSATVENSILGADVVIGNGAVIRNSVLMNNVTIGPGVHILDSIIADRVWVGPDSVIRELSVIGAGLQVAARSEFSSTRLPESD
ncbi:MAG: NDP-sugar synthase [Actinomycetes bacterium]